MMQFMNDFLASLGPMTLFIFICSITPGPNNTILAASGLNFGLRRTLPVLFGINLGFALMLLLSGLGLGAAFTRFPLLHTLLKYVSAAYLLFLAWKIAKSEPPSADNADAAQNRPLTFLQGALFQWVNPKGWVMVMGLVSAYVAMGEGFWGSLGLAALISVVVGIPCIFVWAAFGSALRRWLHKPNIIRAFNWTMALLLVASIILSLL